MSSEETREPEPANDPGGDPPLGKGAKIAVSIAATAIIGATLYMILQKTPDDVVEEHRAAASARADAVQAVLEEARGLPPLTEDTLQAPAERVEIGRKEGNGTLVHVVRLDEAPSGPEFPLSCFLTAPVHEEIRRHLAGAGLSSSVADAKALFDRFDKVRYVLVVVERVCTSPTVSSDAKTFTAGFFAGEAHLFQLEGHRHLGGVRFQATNVKTTVDAMVWKGPGPSKRDSVDGAVRADLTMEAYQRLGQLLEPKNVGLSALPY